MHTFQVSNLMNFNKYLHAYVTIVTIRQNIYIIQKVFSCPIVVNSPSFQLLPRKLTDLISLTLELILPG